MSPFHHVLILFMGLKLRECNDIDIGNQFHLIIVPKSTMVGDIFENSRTYNYKKEKQHNGIMLTQPSFLPRFVK